MFVFKPELRPVLQRIALYMLFFGPALNVQM